MARSYAAYRPRYPAEIFDTIMSYHEQIITSGHQLAVDVCCGTGQSTLPLTKLFHQVSTIAFQNQSNFWPEHVHKRKHQIEPKPVSFR